MPDEQPPDSRYVLSDVGGLVDEAHVGLRLYGDDLDPDVISAKLGCPPTKGHRKGERRRPTSPPFRTGAWILTIEGKAPRGPDDLIKELLGRFPSDYDFWKPLIEQYRASVQIVIHSDNWNRGFDLSAESVAAVARTGLKLGFDLYLYDDEGDEVQ
jgi:hypothetical protein